jgi:hypothetical protein
MSLPFALRSRISLDEPVRRAPRVRLPKVVGPILAYWSVMGVLVYGVSSGALRLDEWFWPKKAAVTWEEPAERDVGPALPAPFPPPPEPEHQPGIAAVDPSLPNFAALEPAAPAELPSIADEHPSAFFQEPGRGQTSPSPSDAPGVPTNPVESTTRVATFTTPEAPPPASVATAEKRAVLALREPPAPHGDWTQPESFAAAASGSRRSPGDAARGARHVDDGAWLFTEDEGRKTSSPSSTHAPVAARAGLPDRTDTPAPARERAPSFAHAATNVGSCEAAAAANDEVMDLAAGHGTPATPDVTRDAYANILANGRYFAPCNVPATMRVEICAAVKNGRAVGVSVSTAPRAANVAECVKRAVTRLGFPSSPRLDVTRTRFDSAR